MTGTGTPSSKPAKDPIQSHLPRSLQTPQTPIQTPRPTSGLKIDTVESIDLTGDDYGQYPYSRSSSTEVVFGEPKVLWMEPHASRPEPLPRSTKKRKSDEMSKGSSPRKSNQESSSRKARETKGPTRRSSWTLMTWLHSANHRVDIRPMNLELDPSDPVLSFRTQRINSSMNIVLQRPSAESRLVLERVSAGPHPVPMAQTWPNSLYWQLR